MPKHTLASKKPQVVPELTNAGQSISTVTAGAVAAIASVGLLGHVTGYTILANWGHGLAVLPISTAVIFIVMAASLLFLQGPKATKGWHAWTGYSLALTAGTIAAIVLVGDIFNVKLLPGILPYADRADAHQVFSFVISSANVAGLMLVIAILLVDKRRSAFSNVIAPVVLLGALVRLLGYVYGDHILYGGNTATPLSLPASLCFILLGTSIFMLRARISDVRVLFADDSAGILLRRLLSGTFLIPIVLGLFIHYGYQAGWFSVETGLSLFVVLTIAIFAIRLWLVALKVYQLDSERMAAEHARATERQLLEVVMQQMPVGIILRNSRTLAVEFANESALTLLGVTSNDMIGFDRLRKPDGSSYAPNETPVARALQSGKIVTDNNVTYLHPEDYELQLRVTAAPVRDGTNEVSGGLIILEDYSKETEVEHAKDEFLSLATHQLQTPLTGVSGFLSLLKNGMAGDLTDEQRELVNEAYEGNEREKRIVTDLLNVARAESGRMVLNKEPTDIIELLSAVLKEQQPTIDGRKQKARLHAPSTPAIITIDPARIRMCLENLVSNASKYTKSGGKIDIRFEQHDDKSYIHIKDSGVGIAKADTSKLFKRFSRIENELSQTVSGTGLGLYLVKQIVELHQGTIEVDSKLGKGTTFTIELPEVSDS